ALRLEASAPGRFDASVTSSRAQLMSSSGALYCPLRAHLTRSAQCASMSSLLASFSSPSIRNGPICSRGNVASSSSTGSVFFAIETNPRRGSAAHRAAGVDLLVDVLGQVADDALVLVVGHQRHALAGDA